VQKTDTQFNKGSINLAVLLPNLDGGGAQKATARLANALVGQKTRVTILVSKGGGVVERMLDPRIRVVDFKSSRVLFSVPGIIRFLNQNQPDILLSIQTNANLAAVFANLLTSKRTKLIVSERSSFSTRVEGRNGFKARMMYILVPIFYQKADLITAVSQGVAEDLKRFIKRKEIRTLYNPVLDDNLIKLAKKDINEPWLQKKSKPVILAVGRLGKEKDYIILIKAIKIVREVLDTRLIILGEGKERAELENLVANLGLSEAVKMPGFVKNPYAYMSKADVFVLSSVREGLPNVLIEALACRVPVVSTDCPYGPHEILDGGRYGGLVPVGEPRVLADAILAILQNRPDTDAAYRRALDFSVEECANEYLRVIRQLLCHNCTS
jgi:glycosyltransferase involved in cell wall biosynthesis